MANNSNHYRSQADLLTHSGHRVRIAGPIYRSVGEQLVGIIEYGTQGTEGYTEEVAYFDKDTGRFIELVPGFDGEGHSGQ